MINGTSSLEQTEGQMSSSTTHSDFTAEGFADLENQPEISSFLSNDSDSGFAASGDIEFSPSCFKTELGLCCTNFFNLKSRFPIIKWASKYKCPDFFFRDFIAGLTVALTVIPQGIAYATVAGLPEVYGLYSSFIGPIVYMLMGTSKDITMGPTAVMSLIVASYVDKEGVQSGPEYAIFLSFFAGCVQILISVLQLGFLINYVSGPVVSGFTSGAAVTIAYSQVPSLFGMDIDASEFPEQVVATFKKIKTVKYQDSIIGLTCLVALLVLRHLKRNYKPFSGNTNPSRFISELQRLYFISCNAANALVVIAATIVSYVIFQFNENPGFAIVGPIDGGFPPVGPPPFGFTVSGENGTNTTHVSFSEMASEISSGFVIVPLLGILESIAIAKSFARQNNYRIDTTQELLAIGVSNVASSFFASYPITGSFSRTAVNSGCNVATPLGGLFTSLTVICSLLFLAPAFQYIPKASLAALIIASIIFNVDYRVVPILWRLKKFDLFALAVTFLAVLIFGAEWGIITGIVFSLLLALWPLSKPRIRIDNFKSESLILVRFDHGLNFPSAESLVDCFAEKLYKLKKIVKNGGRINQRCCVIDFTRVWHIDYSVIQSLSEIHKELTILDIELYIVECCPAVKATLERAKNERIIKFNIHCLDLESALRDFQSKVLKTSQASVAKGVEDSTGGGEEHRGAGAVDALEPNGSTSERVDSDKGVTPNGAGDVQIGASPGESQS